VERGPSDHRRWGAVLPAADPGSRARPYYEDLRSVTALPERVCIIGAADTGCQLTSILPDFGCRVWLLEYAPRIVPRADQDSQIVGAHVLGEYSAEVIQMVAACMAAGMRIEDVAELQLAFATFTEGVGMAARMLVRDLGVRAMPPPWSSLRFKAASEAAT
jgi:pyruvate/2-oxoglutarate dehydrogenase complex dihydrolipoamide dehydrogenase (E3) component